MTTINFHFTSALSPAQVRDVLTDFSPSRAERWPSIDAAHFTVHELGGNWALVTEGTEAAWERARYTWDADEERVTIQTVTIQTEESKLFGPGGGWVFRMTPQGAGSRVEVELTREPTKLKGRLLALLLPLVGPSTLTKSFRGPLRVIDGKAPGAIG